MMDWPDAEQHFTQGVLRLTRIAAGEPRHFRLTDDRIFDYPWIYATQTGWWDLSDRRTARLREYLLRGGFLVVDDLWGSGAVGTVPPHDGRACFPIGRSSTYWNPIRVMHVLYDIQEKRSHLYSWLAPPCAVGRRKGYQ